MLQKARVFGFAVATSLAFGAIAFAYPPEGKYREEIKNPFRGQSYTLIKTLHLRIGGKAEMFFEYKGTKPIVDLLVKDEYGSLMDVIANYRKLRHSGTWKPTAGGRIYVELTKLEAGEETGNLHSAIELELFSNELVARKQDVGDYGDQTMRFKLLEQYNPVVPAPLPGGTAPPIPISNPAPIPLPPPNAVPIPAPGAGSPLLKKSASQAMVKAPEPLEFDPSRRKGNYAYAEEVQGVDGQSLLVRRLKLNGDKSAEVVSEYLGRRPKLEANSASIFGSLFAEIIANRKITHKGSWREVEGRVVVELDRIGGGDFAQNVHSAFIFDPSGSDLDVRELDQGDYGTRAMKFRKDFNPAAPARPAEPERPHKPEPIVKTPKTIELDTQTGGGGFASYEGHRAQELNQLRLILKKDGKFELRVKGSEEVVFKGDYQLRGDRQIELRASEAFGEAGSGAGTVDIKANNAVQKVILRGGAKGKRFTLTFTAR